MKFSCEKNILLKEVSIAQEIISSKNVISILSNIYLETSGNELIIKATDMKVNFETKVPIELKEPGSTTVFGEKFLGILNSVPDGELEVEKKENTVVIKPMNRKIKFQLKCIASETYPEFPIFNKENYFDVPVKEFKEMIQQTVFAVSDDETRYFMNGIFFKKEEEKIVMVATDGRRLAYIEKSIAFKENGSSGIIIPPKILSVLLKRAGDEGMLNISVTDKNIFIRFGYYKLSSVLIEGQFPNYQRVIPENQEYFCTVDRLEVLEALKRVSLLVEQKSYRIYLILLPGALIVSSNKEDQNEEGDIGNAREELSCEYEGKEISIALNYRYIEEPFKIITDPKIKLCFTEANKAITIKPIPEKDFFHIVMPMQLD
ncbi:MAG: DNA polymerase III subunit beta [Spirochaetaceae bacterium]|jgi:DNA polymerase-3 subunit beta|nr:DNA polymerase III subunit beta [Spirochaetaceae bacterium]